MQGMLFCKECYSTPTLQCGGKLEGYTLKPVDYVV